MNVYLTRLLISVCSVEPKVAQKVNECSFNVIKASISGKKKPQEYVAGLTLFEGVIDVEQRQVVSVDVSKPHLGLVSCLLSFRGADKTLWD